MTAGNRAGTNFLLDPAKECQLGRGTDCAVVLTDPLCPLCSRVHAVVERRDGAWVVRDRNSRNGTYVNGQKVDDAVLGDGHVLKIGSTEFVFHQSDEPPTIGSAANLNLTQTIIKDAKVDIRESDVFAVTPVGSAEHANDLLLLYQLSIKFLGSGEASDVIRQALVLLSERTAASVVGFLWRSDDGQLKPKLVMPERAAKRVVLSDSLTRMVCDEGRAIWIANQQSTADDETLQHYADALCVPLVHDGCELGAVHVYLDQGRFRQSDFDFSISLANITARALVRARHEASLQTDVDRLKARSPGYDGLVGECPSMVQLRS
jgi:Nif-specific regulatory protein